ncbi:MAG: dephospho-CoA kinase [Anaerolineales bacterium]
MIDTKKIIGLTGNIATGKSVIRRMLANSSALGIDADMLAHRMLYPNGPAYKPAIKAFGQQILDQYQRISRQKLGEIVFNDTEKLSELESLILPGVIKSILQRIHQSGEELIVIEAIKLLESGLAEICDWIWVSDVSPLTQVKRLIEQRDLSEEAALTRISTQPPQSEKRRQADVVINTEGTFKDTWHQVQCALNDTIQLQKNSDLSYVNIRPSWTDQPPNEIAMHAVEGFWIIHSYAPPVDFFELLGSKMVLPILWDDQLNEMLIWDNWNFTASLIQVTPSTPDLGHPHIILSAFEKHGLSKQCEILLIAESISQELSSTLREIGYQHQPIHDLPYPAWQQAGARLIKNQSKMVWAKILAQPFEISRFEREIHNKTR